MTTQPSATPKGIETVHLDCLNGCKLDAEKSTKACEYFGLCWKLSNAATQVSLGASEGASNVEANTPRAIRETVNPAVAAPTPETDEEEDTTEDWPPLSLVVSADFARQLERDRNRLREERIEAKAAYDNILAIGMKQKQRAEKAEAALAAHVKMKEACKEELPLLNGRTLSSASTARWVLESEVNAFRSTAAYLISNKVATIHELKVDISGLIERLHQIDAICLDVANFSPVTKEDSLSVRYVKDLAYLINVMNTTLADANRRVAEERAKAFAHPAIVKLIECYQMGQFASDMLNLAEIPEWLQKDLRAGLEAIEKAGKV